MAYTAGARFNAFFLIYIPLMTLSAYAMIAVLVSLDATAVRDELTAAIHPRLVGGFLAGLAVLFTALWTTLVVSALIGGSHQLEVEQEVELRLLAWSPAFSRKDPCPHCSMARLNNQMHRKGLIGPLPHDAAISEFAGF